MNEFATENEARRAIIAACLRMNELGINQGKSGNVSVRWNRGGRDGYLITPSGLAYDQTREDDMVWLALDADADRPAPNPVLAILREAKVQAHDSPARVASSEWRMHAAVYRDHPAELARAVVHTHSSSATALSCLPAVQARGIPAFHYMIAIAGGDSIRCAPYATFGSEALARGAMAALSDRCACLLANHGVLAFQRSLAMALAVAHEVETLATMYAKLLPVGEPVVLGVGEMQSVIDKFRTYGQPRG